MSIRQDTRHLYLQVIEQIKRDIEHGIFKEKQKLPSEFQLSKTLGVSRATLREALRILEEDGVVTRRHGVGTFVNSKPLFTSGIEELDSVTGMILKSGMTPGSQYLSADLIDPTEKDKARFSPLEVTSLAKVERVRTADDEPVVYCTDKIPEGLLPIDHVREADSLFQVLEAYTGKSIEYAVTHIEPIGYHERISPILKCEPDQALLLLRQMHYSQDDIPMLLSSNYFRADKFSFHVLRKRV
ncbi:GntR family transcriptional regulator [Halobacillus sp. ACCC02827]|uniref:GntR family transcriptional regulator n=1 Tax=Bacillaceae TaxID=186817 RepID=UPI0002A4DCB6|nr:MULTISPECIES: GntR family transcriptional regulator [Bacillaceae]ELK44478.1 GntR family transcriptional regulator [Halobacillus sp. BAB-2008]QHT46713.1 GntR family transcriptional regulator [Bacillus sp. SB49]WJE17524.1 GntR family transcriptional regulator [Halobacillus sp. ACCC02827]